MRDAAARHVLRTFALLLAWPLLARAERLPVKSYFAADGLASNRISRIVRDSRGYLWFCTEDGLSRFNGYTFTNYTTQEGLPDSYVDDLLEGRDGTYWIATAGGLCRFNPGGAPLSKRQGDQRLVKPLFEVCRRESNESAAVVKVLYEDHSGTLWCGTRRGIYRVEESSGSFELRYVDFGISRDERGEQYIRGIVEDRRGVLWVSSRSGLYRRLPNGRCEAFTTKNGLASSDLGRLMVDSRGEIWVYSQGFAVRVAPELDARQSIVAERYGTRDGLPCTDIDVLSRSADGRFWIGGDCGLSELLPEGGEPGSRIRVHLDARTLGNASVWAVCDDLNGNLWMGTSNGAFRISRAGLTTYTSADGLPASFITSIAQTQSGELFADCSLNRQHFIAWFDGTRFIGFKPNVPQHLSYEWGFGHRTFQDHDGEWWLPTSHGLIRFPKLDRVEQLAGARPKAVYDVADGLPGNNVFHIYEARNGDLWLSIAGNVQARVVRWERAREKFHAYSEADGLPPAQSYYPNAFCEDLAGNLWLALEGGGVARMAGNRFRFFGSADGVPEGDIQYLYIDSSGRLWLASSRAGLGRLDDPNADEPRFAGFTTADGLSSDRVSCILETQPNCFYVATLRGVDYFNFNTGQHRRFTTADGLASDQVALNFADRAGALWFATEQGLSCLPSDAKGPSAACPVFITGLLVNGINQSVSQLGETEMRNMEFAPSQDNIQIDFTGLSFASGEMIRYQYKLEGADEDWSASATERRVNYANLKPGRYRFLVRSVNAEGKQSTVPASVEFRLLAPVYQRLWFLGLAAVAAAAAVYALHRYRVAQLIKLERVRMRIATDLHDDIGSSLSQIAILSEVAQHQLGTDRRAAVEPLSVIAQTSRELVDSMSDIVWAINPRRDSLRDLVQRMRSFASDVMSSRDIDFEFNAPDENYSLRLEADLRREVFLIFKEALNNIVRHSQCRKATIDIQLSQGSLLLSMSDEGRGFNVEAESRGHGLFSMRDRAKHIGGDLDVTSEQGHGTTVILQVPLSTQRKFSFKKTPT